MGSCVGHGRVGAAVSSSSCSIRKDDGCCKTRIAKADFFILFLLEWPKTPIP